MNVAKYFSSLDPSSIRWNDSSKRFENTFTFSIWREVATVTVCYVHQIGIPLFDLSAIFATKERQLNKTWFEIVLKLYLTMYKECQCLIPNDDFSPHLDKASYLSIRVVFFGSCCLILFQNVAPRKSLTAKYAVFFCSIWKNLHQTEIDYSHGLRPWCLS